MVANHLSHLGYKATPNEQLPIDNSLLDSQLLAISHQVTPWYADLVNFKVRGVMPLSFSYQQRTKLLSNAKYYVW